MILLIAILTLNLILSKLNAFSHLNNTLACGLVGFCGPTKPDRLKLFMLGVLNVSRGKNSCGIFMNNKVGYGIGLESEFQDFISNRPLPEWDTYENNTAIIHTRQSSVGAITLENAHPFVFLNDPEDTQIAFAGAHNGTIKNWKELLEEQNIEPALFNVDSEAVLFSIFSSKNFKILSKYKGAASMLFTFTEEPNTLYAFRGAAGNKEERPLFYTKHEEGVYFSSIESSLSLIGNFKYPVLEMPPNEVIKFKEGKIEKTYKISREESLHPSFIVPTTTSTQNQNAVQTRLPIAQTNSFNPFEVQQNQKPATPLPTKKDKFVEVCKSMGKINISKQIYFENFRYYRNGHLLNGEIKKEHIDKSYKHDTMMFKDGILINPVKHKHDSSSLISPSFLLKSKVFDCPFPDIEYVKKKGTYVKSGALFFDGSWTKHKTNLLFPGINYIIEADEGYISNAVKIHIPEQIEVHHEEVKQFLKDSFIDTVKCIKMDIEILFDTYLEEMRSEVAEFCAENNIKEPDINTELFAELMTLDSVKDEIIYCVDKEFKELQE